MHNDLSTPQPVHPAIASLQEAIERENKMRDGAAKLLHASKSQKHSMEASKCLFVSNAKLLALMHEIQQQRAALDQQGVAEPVGEG